MNLSALAAAELPELEAFFESLGMRMPRENLEQFSLPRSPAPGLEVVTLVMRDAGRIVGTIGWIDVPFRLNDALGRPRESTLPMARWPINLYLLPGFRGRGLGKRLMEATREGARLRLVIGGNEASIPVLDRTGWKAIGNLVRVRWFRPLPDPSRLLERFRAAARREPERSMRLRVGRDDVAARFLEAPQDWLPWSDGEAAGACEEVGVPRGARYLQFAFGGALRHHHRVYGVWVNGALSGFFVLAALRGRPPWLACEIVDLDAIPGRERHAIAAARRAALSCADVARLRIASDRFTGALAGMAGRRGFATDHPVRVSLEAGGSGAMAELPPFGRWRLTYGDHDQYRVRSSSQVWARAQEVVEDAAGEAR